MSNEVKITVKTIDESTKEVEKIGDSFEGMKDDIEGVEDSFTELSKISEKSLGGLSGDLDASKRDVEELLDEAENFLSGFGKGLKKLTPEMRVFKDEFSKISSDFKSGKTDIAGTTKALDDLGKRMSEVNVEGGKLPPTLKNIIKGLIGISTAFAAGKALANFVKETIAAAREAGTVTEKLDGIESSWERLKIATGEAILLRVEAELPEGLPGLLDDLAEGAEEQSRLNKAIAEGRFVIDEASSGYALYGGEITANAALIDTLTGETLTQAEAQDLLTQEVNKTTVAAIEDAAAINSMKSEYVELTKLTGKSELALDLWVAEAIAAKGAADDLAASEARLAEVNKSSADAIKENQERLKEFAEIAKQKMAFELTVDVDILGTIESQIEELEFLIAGGGQFDNTAALINEALLRGKITPEQAVAMLARLKEEVEAFEAGIDLTVEPLDVEDILAPATAQRLGEEIKRGLEDIEGIDLGIPDLEGELDDLDNSDTDIEITGDFDEINAELDTIVAKLKFIGGTHTPTITTGGGAGQGEETNTASQFGADFTVPSGFPGDSFTQGLTSGEHVTVTPAGAPQKLMKVRGGITINNQGAMPPGMLEDLQELLD